MALLFAFPPLRRGARGVLPERTSIVRKPADKRSSPRLLLTAGEPGRTMSSFDAPPGRPGMKAGSSQ